MARRTVAFETGKRFHVHKSYYWVQPLPLIIIVVIAFLLRGLSGWIDLVRYAMRSGVSFDVLPVVLIALGLFVLTWAVITGLMAISYKYMTFAFDEREFSFNTGVFVKKRVHIPYEKVQSVNHRASLLQRLIGVCTVTIDSAGGAANKPVKIPYVTLGVAERLRHDLFARKEASLSGEPVEYVDVQGAGSDASGFPGAVSSAAADLAEGLLSGHDDASKNILDDALGSVGAWRGVYGGSVAEDEAVTCEYALSNKQLLLASVTHPAPLIAGALLALCMVFCVGVALTQDDMVSAFFLAFSVPIVLVAAAGGWVLGCLSILLSYGGFKVRRRGTRIEVERGLLSRNFSGIDIERVQLLELRQSVLRRMLDSSEVSLGRIEGKSQDSSNEQSKSGEGLVIHPFIGNDEVEALIDALLPEFAERPRRDSCEGLPKKALWRNIRRRCLWFNWVLWVTLVCLAAWVFMAWALVLGEPVFDQASGQALFDRMVGAGTAVAVVIVVLSVVYYAIDAVFWARHAFCGWNGRFLTVHNDGLTTNTSVVQRKKIQSGNTRDNPFQRRVGLTTLVATTAAKGRQGKIRLIDVPANVGESYLEWMG